MAESFTFAMQIPLYFAFFSSLNSWDHVSTVSVCLLENMCLSRLHTHRLRRTQRSWCLPKAWSPTIKHFPALPHGLSGILCTGGISRAAALWRDPINPNTCSCISGGVSGDRRSAVCGGWQMKAEANQTRNGLVHSPFVLPCGSTKDKCLSCP